MLQHIPHIGILNILLVLSANRKHFVCCNNPHLISFKLHICKIYKIRFMDSYNVHFMQIFFPISNPFSHKQDNPWTYPISSRP